jgi:predicted metalloendopeptidase
MKAYYDSCVNETAIDALGPTPIYPYLSKVLSLFDYSSETNHSLFRLEDASTLADGMIELTMQGSDNLVLMEVTINQNRSNQYDIFFNQPALTLSNKEDYTKPDVIDQYRNGLISLLTQVLGQPNGTDISMRLQKMNESSLSPLGPEAIVSMVDRFIAFESHLANMTTYE